MSGWFQTINAAEQTQQKAKAEQGRKGEKLSNDRDIGSDARASTLNSRQPAKYLNSQPASILFHENAGYFSDWAGIQSWRHACMRNSG